jgi:hypothetical protein
LACAGKELKWSATTKKFRNVGVLPSVNAMSEPPRVMATGRYVRLSSVRGSLKRRHPGSGQTWTSRIPHTKNTERNA